MEKSNYYYKPVWDFIANIIDNSNDFFLSTAIVPQERFHIEFQSLKTRLLNDLAGPASFQFQQIAPLLDHIEKTNKPHPIFRKTVWVNKSKIAKTLDQIITHVPQSVWTEWEQPEPRSEEHLSPKQEFGSPLAWVGMAMLMLGMLYFFIWHIFHGTKFERDKSIFIIAVCVIAALFKFNIIHEKWADRAGWLAFSAMCIGGPLFTIYFVGNFFGWW